MRVSSARLRTPTKGSRPGRSINLSRSVPVVARIGWAEGTGTIGEAISQLKDISRRQFGKIAVVAAAVSGISHTTPGFGRTRSLLRTVMPSMSPDEEDLAVAYLANAA